MSEIRPKKLVFWRCNERQFELPPAKRLDGRQRAFHYRVAAFTHLDDSVSAANDKKQMDIIAGSDEKPIGDIGSGYNIDGKAVCRQFPKTATMIGHFTNPKDRD